MTAEAMADAGIFTIDDEQLFKVCDHCYRLAVWVHIHPGYLNRSCYVGGVIEHQRFGDSSGRRGRFCRAATECGKGSRVREQRDDRKSVWCVCHRTSPGLGTGPYKHCAKGLALASAAYFWAKVARRRLHITAFVSEVSARWVVYAALASFRLAASFALMLAAPGVLGARRHR